MRDIRISLPIDAQTVRLPRVLGALSIDIPTRYAPALSLVGVVALAFALNSWSLSVAGYGNTYYAAAAHSMTMSWKNFFFATFDPGGFSSVDKPPVFLWVDALSVRIFGYSTWSILLPSSIAGTASVGLLWLIVRRYFGLIAATMAGLVMALSPISVASNRLNLPDPFMILALIGAAGLTLRSLESQRWWAWTAGAGALIGVAFNTKMLAAWIPGPALAVALVAATGTVSRASARELVDRLTVLVTVTLVVSASWMLAVDFWPSEARPYVSGSANNTVFDLAFNYNGFSRMGRSVGAATMDTGPGGLAGPGGVFGGRPGPLRMFDNANGGQIGWLLPLAIGGGLLALWEWRQDPARRAFTALFLGWIVLYGAAFSYAQGTYHAFYTGAMVPGVAALVGAGAVAATETVRRDRRWGIAAVGLVGMTLFTQLQIAGRTPDFYGWVRPLTFVTTLTGGAAVAYLALRSRPVTAGIALSVAGLLLLPAAWSLSAAANASLNATLPQAGPQRGASGLTFGSAAFDQHAAELAGWLQLNRDPDATWQLAVPTSQDGSRLMAEYGVSVMSLGGFLGGDNAISVDGFNDLISSGDVRYVLAGEAEDGAYGAFGPGAVLAAVEDACSVVFDRTVPPAYRGALYDCAGAALRPYSATRASR